MQESVNPMYIMSQKKIAVGLQRQVDRSQPLTPTRSAPLHSGRVMLFLHLKLHLAPRAKYAHLWIRVPAY